MNKELSFRTFLSISPNKFVIYLLDINTFKNLYVNEQIIKNNKKSIDFNQLKDFLDNNIYKIEKYIGRFIENIFIIIDNESILNLDIGIKKKYYDNKLSRKHLKNSLVDAKDLFKESYQEQKIMHMLINKYFINGKSYTTFEENLITDYFSIEIRFKSISNNFTNEIENLIEKYQINIAQYIDENYIKNYFKDQNIDLPEMAFKIQDGINENEIKLIPKNVEKSGFFVKFFQLFS